MMTLAIWQKTSHVYLRVYGICVFLCAYVCVCMCVSDLLGRGLNFAAHQLTCELRASGSSSPESTGRGTEVTALVRRSTDTSAERTVVRTPVVVTASAWSVDSTRTVNAEAVSLCPVSDSA